MRQKMQKYNRKQEICRRKQNSRSLVTYSATLGAGTSYPDAARDERLCYIDDF